MGIEIKEPDLHASARALAKAIEAERALELECAHAREIRRKLAEDVVEMNDGKEFAATIHGKMLVVLPRPIGAEARLIEGVAL